MKKLRPLCVDLDGTLIYNDMVQESVILLLKKNIFYIFLLPFWLRKGLAYLKQEIAKRINFDPGILPYNQALITYLKEEKKKGRRIILVTASDQKIANKIIKNFDFFDGAVGSDGIHSYSGDKKRKKLNKEWGEKNYDYAGNSTVDLKVWPDSHDVVVVSSSPRLIEKIKKLNKTTLYFPSPKKTWIDYLRFLRILRWRRNILIFIPLIFEKSTDWRAWFTYGVAFLMLCMCSSSVSILSDLFDLSVDRRHPKKKHRPVAAGKISVGTAIFVSGILFLVSVLTSCFYTHYLAETFLFYFLFSLFYALVFKRYFILRVLGLIVISFIPVVAGMVMKMNVTFR
ncbi:MAG: UbiA family prenyltransferase [Gammaproteobacteria bacterium]|nr:UbiA family prenyltransferase [Gammaproteobacteria bacterium]